MISRFMRLASRQTRCASFQLTNRPVLTQTRMFSTSPSPTESLIFKQFEEEYPGSGVEGAQQYISTFYLHQDPRYFVPALTKFALDQGALPALNGPAVMTVLCWAAEVARQFPGSVGPWFQELAVAPEFQGPNEFDFLLRLLHHTDIPESKILMDYNYQQTIDNLNNALTVDTKQIQEVEEYFTNVRSVPNVPVLDWPQPLLDIPRWEWQWRLPEKYSMYEVTGWHVHQKEQVLSNPDVKKSPVNNKRAAMTWGLVLTGSMIDAYFATFFANGSGDPIQKVMEVAGLWNGYVNDNNVTQLVHVANPYDALPPDLLKKAQDPNDDGVDLTKFAAGRTALRQLLQAIARPNPHPKIMEMVAQILSLAKQSDANDPAGFYSVESKNNVIQVFDAMLPVFQVVFSAPQQPAAK